MERGQQRFKINCAVCHGATGGGNGITKQYGLATVASSQDERIRDMADGEIFNTITHGKNTMLGLRPNVTGGRPLGDHRLHARAADAAQHATLGGRAARNDAQPTTGDPEA